MSKNKTVLGAKRIALSPEVYASLEAEVARIKEKGAHFKLNEAKFAGAMIVLFLAKYLDKEREQIEIRFFDKKTYLKTLIEKSASEDDLSKSLSAFLHQPKTKKIKQPTAAQNDTGEAIT